MTGQTALPQKISKTSLIDLLAEVDRHLAQILQPEPDWNEASSRACAAARFHILSGGQKVRAQLAIQAGTAVGLEANDCVTIAATCELLHNASLIHDDLQDRGRERRGRPAVWVAYGDNAAICAGDLLLSAAYGALCSVSRPQALPSLLKLVHARVASAVAGQSADLESIGPAIDTVEAYEKIATRKSGALLSLPLELILTLAGLDPWCSEARRAAEAFSIGYQIADDIEDLAKDEEGSQDSRPVLNIVTLLSAQHGRDGALQAARQLALHHLHTTKEIASRLPQSSGDLLSLLAAKLAGKI